MATIRLWLRDDKIDKDGLAPIHLIYQLHGQRKYSNTAIKIRPANWDAKAQQAIHIDKKAVKLLLPVIDFDLMPSIKNIETINSNLSAIKNEFDDQAADFKRKKITYSAEMVGTTIKAQKQPVTKKDIKTSIIDFIEQFAIDATTTKRKGTIVVYNNSANHLKDFESTIKTKLTFETIDTTLLKQFRNYLIEVKGLNNTTVAKQLSTLKTMLNNAKQCKGRI